MISSEHTELFVTSNQLFRVPADGIYMSTIQYQRYRRAVADKILETQTSP